MRHPHADLIKEWAEDASRVVQARLDAEDRWEDCEDGPCWLEEYEYRFKPEPKQDVVKYARASDYSVGLASPRPFCSDNLKLTFDGETGKLIKAEVIE